jgi:hypothetical protein
MDTDHTTSSSSSDLSPHWAGHLEPGVVQLIGSKLDHPYVPGAVHLASICQAWRAAAEQTHGLLIKWHSRQLLPSDDSGQRQQQVLLSLHPWLSRMGPQLGSVEVVSQEDKGGADLLPVYVALNSFATSAATAGKPFRIERLGLPLTPSLSLPPPDTLVAALPFLRHLSLPLDTWVEEGMREGMDAFFVALGDLHHLSSLEVGLRITSPFQPEEQPLLTWERLLEAAPKQLQQLSVRVIDLPITHGPPPEVAYTWEALKPFTALQRLQLGNVAAGCDLSPLTQLQALTSLGIKQKEYDDAILQQLLPVKGLLQDLRLGYLEAKDEQDFKQLTALTSLTKTGGLYVECRLPQEVAAGLQRLEWSMFDNSRSPMRPANSSVAGQELAKCAGSSSSSSSSSSGSSGSGAGKQLAKSSSSTSSSSGTNTTSSSSSSTGEGTSNTHTSTSSSSSSSKLKELRLVGEAWTRDAAGTAEALQQLTGLTSLGFSCQRVPGSAAIDYSAWPSQPPMQHLKQLRRLAVPVELLATEEPWLGGLGHLTQLQLAVEWSEKTAAGTWGPEQVFGADQAKVLANLHSCSSTLKVVEVELVMFYPQDKTRVEVLPVVPAVRAWFKRQLPGVYTVLTWRCEMDMDEEEMFQMTDDWENGYPGPDEMDEEEEWGPAEDGFPHEHYEGDEEGHAPAQDEYWVTPDDYVPLEAHEHAPEAGAEEGQGEEEWDGDSYELTSEDLRNGYEICMEDLQAMKVDGEEQP